MNILMLTNVYTPQVGGVTRSIQQFSQQFRERGHRVVIIAPDYDTSEQEDEVDVIRVAAIPEFYEGRYPLPLPVLTLYLEGMEDFVPDVVHTHHPFLLGSMGQAIAARFNVPLVYTHHTRYSLYIENKTNWPRTIEKAIIELVINYSNLCDVVISPSAGIRDLLRQAGVEPEIQIVPTGVEIQRFTNGSGAALRKKFSIPAEAFVVGHVGRLAPEKNCDFLAQSLMEFLKRSPHAHCLIVGSGDKEAEMQEFFQDSDVNSRVHWTGQLAGQELVDAYHALDVFAFASHTETQGMVLTEAMAAGVPVVAVQGTGVQDLLIDGENGWMIPHDDVQRFVDRLLTCQELSPEERSTLQQQLARTVEQFSLTACADEALNVYEAAIRSHQQSHERKRSDWEQLRQQWDAAWQRWAGRFKALRTALDHALTAKDPPAPI